MSDRASIHGFYLSCYGISDADIRTSGIARKVKNQVACFNQEGLNCEFAHCELPKSKLRRGIGSLPGIPDGVAWPPAERLRGANYLYIRRPMFASREFVSMLRTFRSENPDAKVVIELPSYPYDQELKAVPELFFAYLKERKYRKYWKNYVNRIADLSRHDEIFGIPTIPIVNGIDLSSIKVRKPSYVPGGDINIAYVASFEIWHACDLLIRGLAEYYRLGGTRRINIYLAGDGSQIPRLKQLVSNFALTERVTFCGPLDLSELDALFNICTLAVGSMGMHRLNRQLLGSSLKVREYLARGIPFIYSGDEDILVGKQIDYCYQFDSVEAPVDFAKVIEFHDRLYSERSETDIISEIRQFAEKNVSMRIGMNKVIDYFKGEEAHE